MHVTGLEAAIAFFTETRGFETLFRTANHAYLPRETVGFRLLEQTSEDRAPHGNRRLAYYIDVHDVDLWYAELKPKLDALTPGRCPRARNPAPWPTGIARAAPDGDLIAFGRAIR